MKQDVVLKNRGPCTRFKIKSVWMIKISRKMHLFSIQLNKSLFQQNNFYRNNIYSWVSQDLFGGRFLDLLKGIRYSYREGNDVANVKCYFRDVKLWHIGKRCIFRLIFIIQTDLIWKRVHGPLFFKTAICFILQGDYVTQIL